MYFPRTVSWYLPGNSRGEISGSWRVCGTVNDVCMAGRRAEIFESFPDSGGRLCCGESAADCIFRGRDSSALRGCRLSQGTPRWWRGGKGDQVYVNTSGIGVLRASGLGREAVRPGDAVVVSGPVGCHGAAVMMARGELPCEGELLSDCMPLHALSRALIEGRRASRHAGPHPGRPGDHAQRICGGTAVYHWDFRGSSARHTPAFGWPVNFWDWIPCTVPARGGSWQ